MKLFSFFLLALLAATGALNISQHFSAPVTPQSVAAIKLASTVACSPDRQLIQQLIEGTDIPPMPGAGSYQWKINTTNDSAQFYFNQGINTYYGFHIIESLASFKKAATFDSQNAMIWWAQALAYGPNINDVSYAVLPEALVAVQKAKELMQHSSPAEKELILAMSIRYSADSSIARSKLNSDYTAAMKTAYEKFPNNADIAALYTDAMMLEHPWELWNVNGTPKLWTPLIRTVLETSLAGTPQHPGLNHYYIHVMEPSPFPEKAMASAKRLAKLNPGLAHLVHMPSHIYLRTGYYKTGYTANEEAVRQYEIYKQRYPAVAGADFLYRLHNEHMLINCAMHAGRKTYSIERALKFQQSMTPALSEPGAMGNYLGYIYMIPTLTMIRFEAWDELLHTAPVDSAFVYASLLSHFGTGMALANTNKIAQANSELEKVKLLLKDSVLSLPFTPYSPAIDGAMIAAAMLEGTINLKQKKFPKAIQQFSAAVEKEKLMVYNEPRDWLLNPKYYLGDAYLQAGQFKDAEKTFNDDLRDNNENVWSLAGLQKALLQQKKISAAKLVGIRLKKAAAESDVAALLN